MLRPMPGIDVRHGKKKRMTANAWSDARIDIDKAVPALDLHEDLARSYFSAMGIALVRQPPTTRTAGGLTLARYNRKTTSLQGNTSHAADPVHMNAAFGRECLESYLNSFVPLDMAAPFTQEKR